MVTLTIDNKKISVPEGTTIMKAAASAGIIIPHLCYLEGINEISACKACVVEVQGKVKLVTACNNPVEEGMVLFTNSPKVRSVRRTNVELILSQHNSNCATCVRSGNCNLQKLSNDLGILDIPYKQEIMEMPWNREFPLIRDFGKCIKCMLHIWDVQNTGSRTTVDVSRNRTIEESDCSICGQCITHCPTGALRERDDTAKVFRALADPEIVTVVQVAPAVRTAWAESLNLPSYMATEGRMVAAYVFGFPILGEELEQYPALRTARDSVDTGVIISFNSVAFPAAASPLFAGNTVCINPLNWSTDTAYAPASRNLGSVFFNGETSDTLRQQAGARIDLAIHSLIVDGLNPEDYYIPSISTLFPKGNYHVQEINLYFLNVQKNIGQRVRSYFGSK